MAVNFTLKKVLNEDTLITIPFASDEEGKEGKVKEFVKQCMEFQLKYPLPEYHKLDEDAASVPSDNDNMETGDLDLSDYEDQSVPNGESSCMERVYTSGRDSNRQCSLRIEQLETLKGLMRDLVQLLVQQILLSCTNEAENMVEERSKTTLVHDKGPNSSHMLKQLHDHLQDSFLRELSFFNVDGIGKAVDIDIQEDPQTATLSVAKKSYQDQEKVICKRWLDKVGIRRNDILIPGVLARKELFTLPFTKDEADRIESEKENIDKLEGYFTRSEDKLLMQGRNLFGEKEWGLVAQRFFQDTTTNPIYEVKRLYNRHDELCYKLVQSNNILLDSSGSPLIAGAMPIALCPDGDLDFWFQRHARGLEMHPIKEPYLKGLHRWTIEEDVMLLRAVNNVVRHLNSRVKTALYS